MNKKVQTAKNVFIGSAIFFVLYLVYIVLAKTFGSALGAGAMIFTLPSLFALLISPFVLMALIFSGIYWFVNKKKTE